MTVRLLLLVALATLPAVLVLAVLQVELRDGEQRRLAAEAISQAELVNSDLASIVEGARQFTLAVSEYPSVHQFDPSCVGIVSTLDRLIDSYNLVSVADEDGHVICSSVPGEGVVSPVQRELNIRVLATGRFETGVYRPGDRGPAEGGPADGGPGDSRPGDSGPMGGGLGGMLMFGQPFAGPAGRRGVVTVGLSLRWLGDHFSAFPRSDGSFIGISDRNGINLAVVPRDPERIGQPMAPSLAELVRRTERGNLVLAGADGVDRLIGFVPAGQPSSGLFSSVGLSLPALMAPIDQAARRVFWLMALGTAVSASLVVGVGRWLMRGPNASLLAAASALSRGDLAARVPVTAQDRRGFATLAHGFNAMADSLQRRQTEEAGRQKTLETELSTKRLEREADRHRMEVIAAEHARAEQALRQAQKLHAVGQLAGGIAHDFNNLLTAIVGALELLRRRAVGSDRQGEQLLNTALLAADRGGRLMAQLLAFSRSQPPTQVPTDLNTVVRDMLGLLESTLGQAVQIETALEEGLWLARADPNQVEAALLNLALNARDAMSPGGRLTISTSRASLPEAADAYRAAAPLNHMVASRPAPSGAYVRISVSDAGKGMTADILAQVLEPFFTTKAPGRGTGLGLAQVHALASQAGGELWIASTPGVGTCVSLLLPRAEAVAAGAKDMPRLEQAVTRRVARMRPLQVLVADDDPDVLRLTSDMLSTLGHEVTQARHGAEALERLTANPVFDLLLTDYAMPGMNGVHLIQTCAVRWPHIATILVTGHADPDTPDMAPNMAPDLAPNMAGAPATPAGRLRLLRKPFTMALLAAAVDDSTANRGAMGGGNGIA